MMLPYLHLIADIMYLIPSHSSERYEWYTAMKATRAKQRRQHTPNPPSPQSPHDDASLDDDMVDLDHLSDDTAISTLTTVLTFEFDFSNKARAGDAPQVEVSRFDYQAVNWKKLPGFSIPLKSTEARSSPIWRLGVAIQHTESEKLWWLCSKCHAKNNPKRHSWNVSNGTKNARDHLRDVHRLTWNKDKEIISVEREGTPGDLDSSVPREQEILNALAASFDEKRFKQLLLRWIIYDNVSFRQVDSAPFRALITYLSKRAGDTLCCGVTVKDWIMKTYVLHKDAVRQDLNDAVSKIHISFDLWTSGNCLSLNGVTAHYVNAKFDHQTLLLATAEQSNSHAGADIAAEVIQVIKDFGISNNLGYFVLDNASNNDTAIETIAEHFELDPNQRRLRCAGHVINLIARHLLFGFDKNLFELEGTMPANLKIELQRWRRCGPIGKAHNLIVWTYASPQRRKRWHEGK
jgi:hypothetical protein